MENVIRLLETPGGIIIATGIAVGIILLCYGKAMYMNDNDL